MRIYEICLKQAEDLVGRGITTGEQLTKAGRELFGAEYLGTFTIDDAEMVADSLHPEKPYAIINNGTVASGGEHWIALAHVNPELVAVYDSFGRKSEVLAPKFVGAVEQNGGAVVDADYDAEQVDSEKNCGARCLAWLCVCMTAGIELALLI